jgi:hypothetical protein
MKDGEPEGVATSGWERSVDGQGRSSREATCTGHRTVVLEVCGACLPFEGQDARERPAGQLCARLRHEEALWRGVGAQAGARNPKLESTVEDRRHRGQRTKHEDGSPLVRSSSVADDDVGDAAKSD